MSLRTKIFVACDENLLCAGNKHQRFLSLRAIFNIEHARNSFSLLTTEDKIFVASDKNRAVCARLNELYKQIRGGNKENIWSWTFLELGFGRVFNFSRIQVSAIKSEYTFCQKHVFIWVPQGVREANFGRINSWMFCSHLLTDSLFCPFTKKRSSHIFIIFVSVLLAA